MRKTNFFLQFYLLNLSRPKVIDQDSLVNIKAPLSRFETNFFFVSLRSYITLISNIWRWGNPDTAPQYKRSSLEWSWRSISCDISCNIWLPLCLLTPAVSYMIYPSSGQEIFFDSLWSKPNGKGVAVFHSHNALNWSRNSVSLSKPSSSHV